MACVLSDFVVPVYNGSIYNGAIRAYESCDFIYIGFIGFDNKRQNIILTNIEETPKVRVVKRSDIAEYIMAESVRNVSVHHLLSLMKKVRSVPQCALLAWNKAYNVFLNQWVEGMYVENCCKKIQRGWMNALYNPSFRVCKQRLNKEFENLNSEFNT